jgi:sugar lactone lactonase YvrE
VARGGIVLGIIVLALSGSAGGDELWISAGNDLYVLALDGEAASPEVRVQHASRDESGGPSRFEGRRRDVNGAICFLPDGSGRFVLGEDTGQPDWTPGWGVFEADGTPVGRLTPTFRVKPGEPHGCAFDASGRLLTAAVGNKGFGPARGKLFLWFPPFDRFPERPEGGPAMRRDGFCTLADDLGTAGGVVLDDAGRVYVASASRFAIHRFSPPFPTSADAAGGCAARDANGSPMADDVRREVFARAPYTFSGLAFRNGRLYAASVVTGHVLEYDLDGSLVRRVLVPPDRIPLPPVETGHPQGLAFGPDGSLYYADLDLRWQGLGLGAGPDGKVRRIRFDASGRALPPETLLDDLAFPDGIAVRSGSGAHVDP